MSDLKHKRPVLCVNISADSHLVARVLWSEPERLLVDCAGLIVVAQPPGSANFVTIYSVDGFFIVARSEAEFHELLAAVDVYSSLARVPDRTDRTAEGRNSLLNFYFSSKFFHGDDIAIALAVWLVVSDQFEVRAERWNDSMIRPNDHRRNGVGVDQRT